MPRYKHYSQLIFFDTLAVICVIAALLTGWLPGPGGIPLFIVGLSLLAINHEWAKRYIDILRSYADKLGDLIFIPKLRLFFDLAAALLLVLGIGLLIRRSAWWMISLGVISLFVSAVLLMGNRNRWPALKKFLQRQ